MKIAGIQRFPFKSMQGERLLKVTVTSGGLVGDRAWAYLDAETGRIASAKHPGKWGGLLSCVARYRSPPAPGAPLPPVEVELPGGFSALAGDPHLDAALAELLGRPGCVSSVPPPEPRFEMDWPDIDGLYREKNTVTLEGPPAGSFFDVTPVHLLTTASLASLGLLLPTGIAPQLARFRPNFLVETGGEGFPEQEWVGRRLRIGREAVLHVHMPCPRCVMTTVPQPGLSRDLDILRALGKKTRSHFGVYCTVARGGEIVAGDEVMVDGA